MHLFEMFEKGFKDIFHDHAPTYRIVDTWCLYFLKGCTLLLSSSSTLLYLLYFLQRVVETFIDHLDWKRSLTSHQSDLLSSTAKPYLTVPCPLKHLQGWGLHHYPAQPIPMLGDCHHEEIHIDVWPKPPLVQPNSLQYATTTKQIENKIAYAGR